MTPVFRQLTETERLVYAQKVRDWGYPRPLELAEIRHGFWVRNIPETGVLWMVEGPFTPRHWCVHACTAPDCRGLVEQHAEIFGLIRILGGLLDATRVYAPLGHLHPGWGRYLQRYGPFDQLDAIGPYFDLEKH